MTQTKRVVVVLLIAAVLVWIAAVQVPDGRLHVIFLDVDSGQAVIVRTPSGHYALIDGGAHASVVLSALGRHMPFWQRTIDAAVATHQGNSALLPLLEVTGRYRLLSALGPPLTDQPSAAYAGWRSMLEQREIPFLEAQDGTSVDLGSGAHLAVTHSGGGRMGLLISYGQVSVSLPGSGTLQAEDRAATVVAFPASESNLPRSDQLNASAAFVLFTGKRNATAGAPSAAAAGQVFSTAAHGTIEMISDGAGATLRPIR